MIDEPIIENLAIYIYWVGFGKEYVGYYFRSSENALEFWQYCFSDYHLFYLYDLKMSQATIIRDWCRENCKGDWNRYNDCCWAFEKSCDAILFKLRWA